MENNERDRSFRIGPIRPPSEADSLLLQVTNGCTWNKCKFCQLYRHTKFRAYSADSIKEDIDNIVYQAERARKYQGPDGRWDMEGLNMELRQGTPAERESFYMVANWLLRGGENVFLQDGNTTVLSSGRLTDVLVYLKEAFPSIKRITSYGRAQNLAKVSPEGYRELKEAGLDRIHSGYESGSDAVLKKINKGVTQQEEITAGQNIKAGGIELSIYFMPGVGGKELTDENARGTAEVLREVEPDFVRIRTCAVKEGTGLYEDFRNGDMTLASDDEKLIEIRNLIMGAGEIETRLVSDHMINLLQNVEGSMRYDRDWMIAYIDSYLAKPEIDRRMYQAARRMVLVSRPEDMKMLSGSQKKDIKKLIDAYPDPYEWEIKINELISNYI